MDTPNCTYNPVTGTTEAVVLLKRNELMYDIANIAYIEGSMLSGEADPHQQHMVQDVADDGNAERIGRILDLCVCRLREMLYPYTKTEIRRPELDDTPKDKWDYILVLNLPTGFSQTTLDLFMHLCHEYLVAKAVEEWVGLTNEDRLEYWQTKAAVVEAELRTNLNTRTGRLRKRMHPF